MRSSFLVCCFRESIKKTGGGLAVWTAFKSALVGAGIARLIPAGGAITPVAMSWTVRDEVDGTAGAAVRTVLLNYAGLLIVTGFGLLICQTGGFSEGCLRQPGCPRSLCSLAGSDVHVRIGKAGKPFRSIFRDSSGRRFRAASSIISRAWSLRSTSGPGWAWKRLHCGWFLRRLGSRSMDFRFWLHLVFRSWPAAFQEHRAAWVSPSLGSHSSSRPTVFQRGSPRCRFWFSGSFPIGSLPGWGL